MNPTTRHCIRASAAIPAVAALFCLCAALDSWRASATRAASATATARNRETPAATIAAPESRIGDRGELAALVAAGFTPARGGGP